jgi:hypothetical protein
MSKARAIKPAMRYSMLFLHQFLAANNETPTGGEEDQGYAQIQ